MARPTDNNGDVGGAGLDNVDTTAGQVQAEATNVGQETRAQESVQGPSNTERPVTHYTGFLVNRIAEHREHERRNAPEPVSRSVVSGRAATFAELRGLNPQREFRERSIPVRRPRRIHETSGAIDTDADGEADVASIDSDEDRQDIFAFTNMLDAAAANSSRPLRSTIGQVSTSPLRSPPRPSSRQIPRNITSQADEMNNSSASTLDQSARQNIDRRIPRIPTPNDFTLPSVRATAHDRNVVLDELASQYLHFRDRMLVDNLIAATRQADGFYSNRAAAAEHALLSGHSTGVIPTSWYGPGGRSPILQSRSGGTSSGQLSAQIPTEDLNRRLRELSQPSLLPDDFPFSTRRDVRGMSQQLHGPQLGPDSGDSAANPGDTHRLRNRSMLIHHPGPYAENQNDVRGLGWRPFDIHQPSPDLSSTGPRHERSFLESLNPARGPAAPPLNRAQWIQLAARQQAQAVRSARQTQQAELVARVTTDQPSRRPGRIPFANMQHAMNTRLRRTFHSDDRSALEPRHSFETNAQPVLWRLSESRQEAIRHIQHLAEIRDYSSSTWRFDRCFNDLTVLSQYAHHVEVKGEIFPFVIADLPVPQPSSWLEPGITWTGTQCNGIPDPAELYNDARDVAPADPLEGRDEEYQREWERQVRINDTIDRASLVSYNDEQERRERGLNEFQVTVQRNRLEYHQRMNEYNSHRRERGQERQRRRAMLAGIGRTLERGYPVIATGGAEWPVTVTILKVNYHNMTIRGFITASQIPSTESSRRNPPPAWSPTSNFNDRLRAAETAADAKKDGVTRNVVSLFDGEIIDLQRHGHELETVSTKPGYNIGGPDIDIAYWAGVGPFKVEVEKQRWIKLHQKRRRAKSLVSRGDLTLARKETIKNMKEYLADLRERQVELETQRVVAARIVALVGKDDEDVDDVTTDDGVEIAEDLSDNEAAAADVTSDANATTTDAAKNGESNVIASAVIDDDTTAPNDNAAVEGTTQTQPSLLGSGSDDLSTILADANSELAQALGRSSAANGASRPRPASVPAPGAAPAPTPHTTATYKLTDDEEAEAVDLAMIRALNSKQWLQGHLGENGEWLLMRWKERSFTSSSSAESAANDDEKEAETDLTISGHYYVALHRPTGAIDALYYDSRSAPFQRLTMEVRGGGGLGIRREVGCFEFR